MRMYTGFVRKTPEIPGKTFAYAGISSLHSIYGHLQWFSAMTSTLTPISLDQVADHLEHLLMRYEELLKANTLLQAELLQVEQERDSLKSRLSAARARVDALLARLPQDDGEPATAAQVHEVPHDWGVQRSNPAASEEGAA